MVGESNRQGIFEWVIEGDGEIIVVVDAISQALKWQSMIVLEKANFICEIGWQHGYIRPIEYSVFYF